MYMILAVHQPNYLPWPGFFYKIAQSDVFVLMDAVQFPRGSSIGNRNLIKTPQGTQFLTVPLNRQGASLRRYNEILTLPGWRKKHLKALQLNYAKAAFYKELYSQLEGVLMESKHLVEINNNFIHWVCKLLKLKTPMFFLSALEGLEGLKKSELIAALCHHFSADCYLSGQGGAAYNEPELFNSNNIKLQYLNYRPQPYTQLWGGFVPNLSIVDMLFNCGPEFTRNLLLKENI